MYSYNDITLSLLLKNDRNHILNFFINDMHIKFSFCTVVTHTSCQHASSPSIHFNTRTSMQFARCCRRKSRTCAQSAFTVNPTRSLVWHIMKLITVIFMLTWTCEEDVWLPVQPQWHYVDLLRQTDRGENVPSMDFDFLDAERRGVAWNCQTRRVIASVNRRQCICSRVCMVVGMYVETQKGIWKFQ